MEKKNTSNWLLKLPNKLTWSRIAAIPILLIIHPLDIGFLNLFSAGLFAIAAITDFFDGYLARKYNTATRIGGILDPIADKLLVTAAIILLAYSQIMPAWMAGLFLCREVAVSGLRAMAAEKQQTIKVSYFAKWKTAVQGVALFVLLSDLPEYHSTGMITAWVALALSYYSGFLYWQEFWSFSDDQQPVKTKNNDPQ